MKKTGLAAVAASVAALALHVVVEGYRWQMGFIYVSSVLASIIVGVGSRRRNNRSRVWKPIKFAFYSIMVIFTLGSAVLSIYLPVFNLPKPNGQYAVGTESFHFMDVNRDETFTTMKEDKRQLMVQLWYPAEATADKKQSPIFPTEDAVFKEFIGAYAETFKVPAITLDYWKYAKSNAYKDAKIVTSAVPYPVVMLSHGFGTGKVIHAGQAESLASHGYIVVAIDHTYNTMATAFPDGNITKFSDAKTDMDRNTNSNVTLDIWANDVKFVLKQLKQINEGQLSSQFTGKLDMGNVGVMGHSIGGATAFKSYYSNPDLKAGVLMDSSMFELEKTYDITKPFMIMEAENTFEIREKSKKFITDEELKEISLTREEMNGIIEDNNKQYKIIDHIVDRGGTMIYIEGTKHFNFTDLQMYTPLASIMGITGELDGNRGAFIVNQYVLDFFNKHLKGTEGEIIKGSNPKFPEVKFPYEDGH